MTQHPHSDSMLRGEDGRLWDCYRGLSPVYEMPNTARQSRGVDRLERRPEPGDQALASFASRFAQRR